MHSEHPLEVLGLSADADAKTIRARYLELVARHPPDRDPRGFEQVRRAYEQASDPEAMARERVLGPEPLTSLAELVEIVQRAPRGTASATTWLDALKELSASG